MEVGHWEYGNLTLEGLSLAGIRTSITLPQYSIAFDVAQGLPHNIAMSTFLLTHGHMDHAAGMPYIISQKAMNSHRPPQFIMPHSMVEPMHEIMKQWSKIEEHKYDYSFIGAAPGDTFPFRPNLFIKVFKTLHRVPSQGYSIIRTFRKLKKELAHLASKAIAQMSKDGINVTEERNEILVSFSGDTEVEFLEQSPELLHSKILMLETTYLDERKTIESAKQWGHTHLEELIPILPKIKSQKIILIHTSGRYSFLEAQRILSSKLPPGEADRVSIFPGR